jgi:hypothetical protein
MSVFWTNKTVFYSILFVLACAILQRPLLSLMTGINSEYNLFTPAYFTLLTSSFMSGSVVASLMLAARNKEDGLENTFPIIMGITIVLYALMFYLLHTFNGACLLAMISLFIIGFGECFARTGNIITLQTKTPENLRSRVLGNTFMISRATGAIAVACAGLLIDQTNFTVGLIMVALFATLVIILGLVIKKYRK